jgi:hypothetical protein
MGASLWAGYCGGFFFLNITKADKSTIGELPILRHILSDQERKPGRTKTNFALAFPSDAT